MAETIESSAHGNVTINSTNARWTARPGVNAARITMSVPKSALNQCRSRPQPSPYKTL